VRVPAVEVGLDVTDQRADGIERAAADRLPRQDAKPQLDHVAPRDALGRGVEVHPWGRRQPGLDVGVFWIDALSRVTCSSAR